MKLCGEFLRKALEAMSLAISMHVLVKGAAALLAARKWQALRVSKSRIKVHWLSIGSGSNGRVIRNLLDCTPLTLLTYSISILFFMDIFLKLEMHNEVTMNQSLASEPGSPPTSRGLWVHLSHRKLKETLNCEGKLSGKSFPGIWNPYGFGSVLVTSKVW